MCLNEFMNKDPKMLFKYKAGDQRNVIDVLLKRLWIPTSKYLNDPDEPFFYTRDLTAQSDKKYDDISKLVDNCFVLSFSASPQDSPFNKTLWNYYTYGLKGFCLAYNINAVTASFLKKFGVKNYVCDYVDYKQLKRCVEDLNFNSNQHLSVSDLHSLLFIKGAFWEKENEFRFVALNEKECAGTYINNICPSGIYLGERMNDDLKTLLCEFAKANKVPVFLVGRSFNFQKEGIAISEYE